MNSSGLKKEPLYKTLSGRSLIEFTYKSQDDLIDYQAEMLKQNKIPGLIGLESLRVDQETRLTYDITSLIPMVKLIERMEISRHTFLSLIRQIIILMERLDEYLLDSDNLVLDCSYIFAAPEDFELFFIYLPQKNAVQRNNPMKTMLLDLIVNKMHFSSECTDNYVQQMLELLKKEELGTKVLKEYLNRMAAPKAISYDNSKLPSENLLSHVAAISVQADESSSANLRSSRTHSETAGSTSGSSTAAYPNVQENKITKRGINNTVDSQGNHTGSTLSAPIMPPNAPAKQTIVTNLLNDAWETIKVDKTVYPKKSYIILGCSIAAVIVLGIALSFTETFSTDNPDFFLSLIGFLMIGGASSYLVYSKVFTPDKRIQIVVEKRVKRADSSFSPQPGKPVPPAAEKAPYPNHQKEQRSDLKDSSAILNPSVVQKPEYVNKSIKVPMSSPLKNVVQAKKEASSAYQDRTVILDAGTKTASLKRLLGASSETILITRLPFMIGRLKEQVDYYLDNPAVGKMHAEISKKPDGYYLSDMNSRNGTLVDGERLEPGKEYRLKDASRITFANEDFIFSEPRVS
ncbi:MAG: DUF6382 domain-containing protein [Clostridia bacterium]|nr:DUF6382 domain-containing protein [Clostridia bacterium]